MRFNLQGRHVLALPLLAATVIAGCGSDDDTPGDDPIESVIPGEDNLDTETTIVDPGATIVPGDPIDTEAP